MRHGKWGAGILLVARQTGRVLLLQRGEDCNEPLTWGLPGGKIDEGENARTAAVRELEEEAGWYGPVSVMKDPIFIFEEPDFEFRTYFGYIEEEFEPQLNWESADAGWFSLNRFPSPLHFGVAALRKAKRRAVAAEIDRIRR